MLDVTCYINYFDSKTWFNLWFRQLSFRLVISVHPSNVIKMIGNSVCSDSNICNLSPHDDVLS